MTKGIGRKRKRERERERRILVEREADKEGVGDIVTNREREIVKAGD